MIRTLLALLPAVAFAGDSTCEPFTMAGWNDWNGPIGLEQRKEYIEKHLYDMANFHGLMVPLNSTTPAKIMTDFGSTYASTIDPVTLPSILDPAYASIHELDEEKKARYDISNWAAYLAECNAGDATTASIPAKGNYPCATVHVKTIDNFCDAAEASLYTIDSIKDHAKRCLFLDADAAKRYVCADPYVCTTITSFAALEQAIYDKLDFLSGTPAEIVEKLSGFGKTVSIEFATALIAERQPFATNVASYCFANPTVTLPPQSILDASGGFVNQMMSGFGMDFPCTEARISIDAAYSTPVPFLNCSSTEQVQFPDFSSKTNCVGTVTRTMAPCPNKPYSAPVILNSKTAPCSSVKSEYMSAQCCENSAGTVSVSSIVGVLNQ